jgi:hypothetical protein
MIGRILSLFSNKDLPSAKELRRFKELPEGQFRREFPALLHDLCVRHAADFINRELHKKDSSFRTIEKTRFFHEIMIVNLWAIRKVFPKSTERLLPEVHACYVRTFHPENDPVSGYSYEAFCGKHRSYDGEWDEESGHQDEFGLKVAEHIFGNRNSVPEPRHVSFWIVDYTHTLLKKLRALKKRCKSAGLAVS